MKADVVVRIAVRWRWALVLIALVAVTAYWFLYESTRETSVASSRAPTPDQPGRPPETTPSAVADSAMTDSGRDRVDLFAPRTWEPPPPPVVLTPAPPPPPQAPPLPFRFFGRIVDSGQAPSFVLTRGSEMITVHVGDHIEPAYLVDKFDGTQLHLVYLPLNIRQTIFVANANE